ncbi:MAG: family 16 glycoside hydrolase [Deltaproteobacteria bacterium]|nr:family 16 glycoside hydrolase [Deltaproteobacteria bacterium]
MSTFFRALVLFGGLFAFGSRARAAPPLPINGIAGATLRAHDMAAISDFYGNGAGFREQRVGQSLRFAVGASQYLEFLPGAVPNAVIHMHSVGLAAPDLKAVEANLKLRNVAYEKQGQELQVRDPFGHLLRFVRSKGVPVATKPAPGFSQHLQHVGLVVNHKEEDAAMRFYRDTLGLEESFRMNDKGGRPTLIKYLLPGSAKDVIELIFVWGPINRWAAGSAYHINFAVDNIDAAYCHLFKTGLAHEDKHFPKVNGERLWAIDMIDPELTRVEVQVMTHAAEEIGAVSNQSCAGPEEELKLFNGKNLDGWTGEPGFWRVEDGQIVGDSKQYMHHNSFLWHNTAVLKDFYLSVWIKQTPSHDRNSGIQFRSQHIEGGNGARGYQADVGTGLWGRLYHEEGRMHLFRKDTGEKAVDWSGWNHYEILAVGHKIWTAVNGTISVAVEDPKGELSGQLALQIHFDPQQVVRYRDLKVIRNPPVVLAGKSEDELKKLLVPVKEEEGR